MDHARMKRINSTTGKRLSGFFAQAITDADRLPGRTALKAQIAELASDIPGLDQGKVYDAFVRMAKRSQRGSGVSRFQVRGELYELTNVLVERIQAADRLLDPEDDSVDSAAIADAVEDDGYMSLERQARAEARGR